MNRVLWLVAGVLAGLLVGGVPLLAQQGGPNAGFDLHADAGHKDYVAGRTVTMHHYCREMGNVTMCLMFDSDGAQARLVGVEPIIPAAQWKALSAGERSKWHPHRPEIESGNIKLIGVPPDQAAKIAESVKGTYGESIFFWRSGGPVPTRPAFGGGH